MCEHQELYPLLELPGFLVSHLQAAHNQSAFYHYSNLRNAPLKAQAQAIWDITGRHALWLEWQQAGNLSSVKLLDSSQRRELALWIKDHFFDALAEMKRVCFANPHDVTFERLKLFAPETYALFMEEQII